MKTLTITLLGPADVPPGFHATFMNRTGESIEVMGASHATVPAGEAGTFQMDDTGAWKRKADTSRKAGASP